MTEPVENTTPNVPPSVFVTYADSIAGRAIVKAWVRQGAKVAGSTINGTQGAATIRSLGAVPTYTDLTREGDIRSTLAMTKADIIIDLSSTLVNQLPFSSIDANIAALGVVPLLNAAHASGVKRLIYVSFLGALPGAGHDDHGDDHHGHTRHASLPVSTDLSRDNDIFKALARAESVLLKSDFNVVVLRAGYLYGDRSPALDSLITGMKAGRPILSGKAHVPFVHTDDLASAVLLVSENQPPSRVYHITDDHALTFDDFVGKLGRAIGIGQPLSLPLLNVFVTGFQETLLNHSVHADASLAKAELGWSPRFATVESGFDQMLLEWRAAEAPALPAPAAQETALVKA